MYRIRYTSRFSKRLVRLVKSGKVKGIEGELTACLEILQKGAKLSAAFRDHPLKGMYAGLREFHLRPDVLVIYEKNDTELVLLFVEIGSHSDLF